MAGKRHHFIPQFLQKGFASHFVGDEAYTWVYRKGVEPYNSNIKNVGVEGFFYSENNDPSLDDGITNAESDFAQLLKKLRHEGIVGHSDYYRVAQLFAHLEIRTRHLRQSFFNTGDHLFNELMAQLSDPVSFESYFWRTIKNDPSIIKNSVSSELRKSGFPQGMLPKLTLSTLTYMKQALPDMINNMPEMKVYVKAVMPAKLKQVVKSGHIRALNETLAPDQKVRRYEKLKYKIDTIKEPVLLLGDSAILFHVKDERGFKPFLEKNDVLKAVILPITPQQVLVGSLGNYSMNFSALRHAVASCSLEHFIAPKNSPENEDFSSNISENAHLLSKYQIEQLISEIMNE